MIAKKAKKRIKAEKLRKLKLDKDKLISRNNSPSQSPGELEIVTCKFLKMFHI